MKELLKLVTPPAFIVVTTTIGFFSLLALLVFRAVPPDSKEVLNVLIGSVGTAWTGIVGYYFGSSSGSARKTDMLTVLTGAGGDGTATTNSTIKTESVTTVTPPDPTKEKQ